jgi:RNA polymerase sigma factor (TIGR02999 family)
MPVLTTESLCHSWAQGDNWTTELTARYRLQGGPFAKRGIPSYSPHRGQNANAAQATSMTRDIDPSSESSLFATLYAELRQIAQRELHRNSHGTALSPTTVLHEAYLRLQQRGGKAFSERGAFLAYASRVMRNLVIDLVRRRRAIKRGGGFEITSLSSSAPAPGVEVADLERLGTAIDTLAALDPALGELVDLKFFCGFSFVEIASTRGVSERTVQRDWEKARILLRRALEGQDLVS